MAARFTVEIEGLNAVLAELTAAGLQVAEGDVAEALIDEASTRFADAVRAAAPQGRGRLAGWQRHSGRRHGDFKRSVRRTLKRGGLNTTARVRVGPIGSILRHGARPHDISARTPLGRLFTGSRFVHRVHHPGMRGNDFWDRAVGEVDGKVAELARGARFNTADRIAAAIERRR
jgi:hypothetical protein